MYPEMTLGLVLCLAMPAAFWIGYLRYKDRGKPESWSLVLSTFLAGMIAAGLTYLFHNFLIRIGFDYNPWLMGGRQLFLYSIFVTGPIEEGAKAGFVVFFVLRCDHFDEASDGVLYASISALGFATLENLIYWTHGAGLGDMTFRAIASPFGHMAFASIWGYGLAQWKMVEGREIRWAIRGFIFASIIHGTYNFGVLTGGVYQALAALLILTTWVWLLFRWAHYHRQIIGLDETEFES